MAYGAVNRSSAPPTQLALLERLEDGDDFDGSPNDPRLDPEYAAYYHSHSRLDPRLPPPIYAPGQSWHVWATSGSRLQAEGNELIGDGHLEDADGEPVVPLAPESRRLAVPAGNSPDRAGHSTQFPTRHTSHSGGAVGWSPQRIHPTKSDLPSPQRRNLVDLIQQVGLFLSAPPLAAHTDVHLSGFSTNPLSILP